jgi:GT2 family glycosyltransferase
MSKNRHKLISGVESTEYLFAYNHYLLAGDAFNEHGPNIGNCGQNLTISFLSLNRSSLSERLLITIARNIPHFAGEVLIIDNGSNPQEIEHLKQVCKQMPYSFRIIELGNNYGVAGGRNRTIPYVNTDWIMFLDNDTYLFTNPLTRIQEDLSLLGCHFLNIPLLNKSGFIESMGGHFYIWPREGKFHVICKSAWGAQKYDGTPHTAYFSTFLTGGACIINKQSFINVGLYDEEMFVGYEDLDLSIRLFQGGYKVGNTGFFALIHDHKEAASMADKKYEAVRWSLDIIKHSADYFEKKHNLVVWDDELIDWIARKQ